jgi:hypothetical protein
MMIKLLANGANSNFHMQRAHGDVPHCAVILNAVVDGSTATQFNLQGVTVGNRFPISGGVRRRCAAAGFVVIRRDSAHLGRG